MSHTITVTTEELTRIRLALAESALSWRYLAAVTRDPDEAHRILHESEKTSALLDRLSQ